MGKYLTVHLWLTPAVDTAYEIRGTEDGGLRAVG
jgi:hypothetical protein